MRFAVLVAAAAALCVQPASAGTIVQTASNQFPGFWPGTFRGFDYSLGPLNSVTLEISASERRIFGATYPDGATDPITINWSIQGEANFDLFNLTSGTHQRFAVPIMGAGEVIVTKGWSWEMTPQGSGMFSIDPSLIPSLGSNGFNPELYLDFNGPGFYDGSDTQFTTSAPIQINQAGGYCSLGFGDERCNFHRYRLTYNYGVPEPATWAMMLLGFGFIGGAMRSARRGKLTFSYA